MQTREGQFSIKKYGIDQGVQKIEAIRDLKKSDFFTFFDFQIALSFDPPGRYRTFYRKLSFSSLLFGSLRNQDNRSSKIQFFIFKILNYYFQIKILENYVFRNVYLFLVTLGW